MESKASSVNGETPTPAKHAGGRPRKREKYARQIARIEKQLAAILDEEVADALRELVRGVWREIDYGKGRKRIYQQPPSIAAIQEVMNRVMGKPIPRLELEALVREEAQRIADSTGKELEQVIAEVNSILAGRS